jgi:hypothetical protein
LQVALGMLEIAPATTEGMEGRARGVSTLGVGLDHPYCLGETVARAYVRNLHDNPLSGQRVSDEQHESAWAGDHMATVRNASNIDFDSIPNRRSPFTAGPGVPLGTDRHPRTLGAYACSVAMCTW